MLSREQQVDHERVEVVGHTSDRGGCSGFHLAMNRLARRRASATAAWPSCSMVSKIAQ
jgi:outer membrane protein OmpA-like peptidoglycan-associated protein